MTIPVLVLGAGGHAKVLIDALLKNFTNIAGVLDVNSAIWKTTILGVHVLGNDDLVMGFSSDEILLVNGIGSVDTPSKRQEIFDRYKKLGYRFATVVHPSAVIASDVELGEGAQVMAGAVIQTGSRIGSNSIVNTKASVDHDCVIGIHSHIAPGVTLSGGVLVGDLCHVGAGATVVQNICIEFGSVVGSGSVVLKNVPQSSTVVGVPAKVMKR